MQRYPASTRTDDCKARILELQEKLVEKSYLSARLYYDLKEYRAATVSLANSLKEYPDTKYREELMYLKLDALYLLAENSIPDRRLSVSRLHSTSIIRSLRSSRRAGSPKMWQGSSKTRRGS